MKLTFPRSVSASLALISGIAPAQQPGTVESIQPYRAEQVVATPEGVEMQLVNLNTNVNALYILRIKDKGRTRALNLQNALAPSVELRLNGGNLEFIRGNKITGTCPNVISAVSSPEAQSQPFGPVCDGKLYVRNRANGYQPALEKGVQVLRSILGDKAEGIINTAKDTVFEDKYKEEASLVKAGADKRTFESKALKRAQMNENYAGQAISNHKLGVRLAAGYDAKAINAGEWYPASQTPNVYVSVITPGMVSPEILKTHTNRVQPLQPGESNSITYLIAFDMKKFTLGWAHGTNQPGIGWSERVTPEQRQAFGGGAGPSGVNSFGDINNPGHVPPHEIPKTVATISGGFQLKHGHFPWGKYSRINKSTHFGFIENGVVMALPSPGLSTLYVRIDGTINMKTWTEADNAEIPKIRYLRQNNLPLIEPDQNGAGIPGDHVGNRSHGNWSGSAEGNNYTPRGAACLIESQSEQYFVYAYFSAATPNAMARVFQAYGCKQAIHLDMNSPGQSYLSLMSIAGQKITTQPLTTDMPSVNPQKDIPRYLAVPDFRDFFWVTRK